MHYSLSCAGPHLSPLSHSDTGLVPIGLLFHQPRLSQGTRDIPKCTVSIWRRGWGGGAQSQRLQPQSQRSLLKCNTTSNSAEEAQGKRHNAAAWVCVLGCMHTRVRSVSLRWLFTVMQLERLKGTLQSLFSYILKWLSYLFIFPLSSIFTCLELKPCWV